jgi:hypothetical protein
MDELAGGKWFLPKIVTRSFEDLVREGIFFVAHDFNPWIFANRVRGVFAPPLPTPPGMRVRTRRFTEKIRP